MRICVGRKPCEDVTDDNDTTQVKQKTKIEDDSCVSQEQKMTWKTVTQMTGNTSDNASRTVPQFKSKDYRTFTSEAFRFEESSSSYPHQS